MHVPLCVRAQADIFSFGVMMYEVMQRYVMLSAVAVRGTYEELEAVSEGWALLT
jgi:hypothetical protein